MCVQITRGAAFKGCVDKLGTQERFPAHLYGLHLIRILIEPIKLMVIHRNHDLLVGVPVSARISRE